MKSKFMFPFLLLLIACGAAQAQSEDDKLLPPDTDGLNPPEEDVIEGSGAGVIEAPVEHTTETDQIPDLEGMDPTTPTPADNDKYLCPEVCTCNTELDGESVKYAVDCSDKNLEEFPEGIDKRATELNLQHNKVTVIPIAISELKSLQVLNLNDNSITELAAGSISELPELKSLKLSNNRLLEYPQELKNGFSLVKVEEIDLSGNDIRSTLSVENFSNFIALRKLILPTSDKDFVEVLCTKMKNSLETVCVGSCQDWTSDCLDAPEHIEDDFMGGKLPGTISLTSSLLDVAPVEGVVEDINIEDAKEKPEPDSISGPSTDGASTEPSVAVEATTVTNEKGSADFSLRTAVVVDNSSNNIATSSEDDKMGNQASGNKEPSESAEGEVKVGATTSNTNAAGVDKGIIGIIVAGMILIVAGITIKKNWSSLRKRFGSGSTTVTERAGVNGTTPEEVPLQDKDKSPV